MQTLNVGAGQTDEEYKASEEQRRAELLSDIRSDANYFFWAAGLSALGTGLLPVRLNLLVSIGTVDLLTLHGRPLGPLYPLVVYCTAVMWFLVMKRQEVNSTNAHQKVQPHRKEAGEAEPSGEHWYC